VGYRVKNEPLALSGGRLQPDPDAPPFDGDLMIGADGRIAALAPGRLPSHPLRTVPLAGRLVVPGLVDAHQHLDKSRTVDEVPNPDGTLNGAVSASAAYAQRLTRESILERADKTLQACLAQGTVVVRSHANIDPVLGIRAVEGLIEVRERWRDRVRLQVVAFLSGAAPDDPRAARWLDDALAAGADVVGGTPARASDPDAFLDLLFKAAERSGRPIDLHQDEHLDPANTHFSGLIARTRAFGMGDRVVASHCSALSAMPANEAQRVIEGFAAARIGVITLPAANLFLQGRDSDRLPPRGLAPVLALARAGVTVACGSDNIRDPFVPTGSGDLLEIARWTLLAAHLGSHERPRAFRMITREPARLLGVGDDHGLRVGARADLLITDAEDAADLVAGGPFLRTVLKDGCIVSGTL